jgi:Tol biopolymer transport system component
MNADGSDQHKLTNDKSGDYAPAFSPDGTRIAYQSTRKTGAEIFVTTLDGTGTAQLTHNHAGDFVPSWVAAGPSPG